MKKNTKSLIIGGIALALYLVLTLAVPFPRTDAYKVAFAFGLFAILAQAYVMHAAFRDGEPVISRFYGYPIARIGVIYMVVQIAVSLIIMALGFAFEVPVWAALVICVLILGGFAILFFAVDMTRDEVERQDAKLKDSVKTMRTMQNQAVTIAGQCGDADTRQALTALAEKFRYSDPVSSDALAEIETALAAKLDELQTAVADGDQDAAKQLCASIEKKLDERNRICKLNK